MQSGIRESQMASRIEPHVLAEHERVASSPPDGKFAALVEMMNESPVAVLIGPPGEATTQFARAAAIACAEARHRLGGRELGDVVVLFDQWGADPLVALCDAIAAALSSASGVPIARSPADRRPLSDLLARWADRTGAHFLIVLNHYERNLAAEPLHAGNARFAEQLAEAIDRAGSHVRFLVVVGTGSESTLSRLTARLAGRKPGVIRLTAQPTEDQFASPEIAAHPAPSADRQIETTLPEGFSALADDQIDRAATEAILHRRDRRQSAGRRQVAALGAGLLIVAIACIALVRHWLTPDPTAQLARTLDSRPAPVEPAPDPVSGESTRTPPSTTAAPAEPYIPIAVQSGTATERSGVERTKPLASTPPAPSTARSNEPTTRRELPAEKPIAAVSPGAAREPESQSSPPLIRSFTLASPAGRSARGATTRETRPSSFAVDAPPGPPVPAKTARAVANPERGPMLFIHIRDESQHAQARRIAGGLARLSIVVSGIRVDESGPLRADLRYFRAGERDEANYLGRALATLGLSGLRVTHVRGHEAAAATRHFELWLPPPAR